MKRVVSIILVLVFMLCGTAMADRVEQLEDSMRTFSETYKKNPAVMEQDENVMYSYVVYKLYCYYSTYDTIDAAVQKASQQEGLKTVLQGFEELAELPEETFNKWLSGEITNGECEEVLMVLIDALIEKLGF